MSKHIKNPFSGKYTGIWVFVAVALAVAILLAAFGSRWASSSPDGLEKVAGDKGFADKANKEPVYKQSPMKGYSVPGVTNEKTSTGISGLAGIAITAVVMLAVAMLALGLGRVKKRKAMVPPADET